MTTHKIDVAVGDAAARPTHRRGARTSAVALLLAGLLAGHQFVPNVRGLGSLLDSVIPFLGLGIMPLVAVALLRRSAPALGSVLVPTVVWTASFGIVWLPGPADGPAELTVISQNVRAGNPDPAATVNVLLDADPDLIALQEISEHGHRPIAAALAPRYPHRVVLSTVALWSRWPIQQAVGVDTGLDWTRALRAVVAGPTGDIVVYVVHLGSARAGDTVLRDRTVATLAATLRQERADRLIVVGDFNTATTDRVITPLTDLLRDAQADAGSGPGFTWPAPLPVTRPDHVLYRGFTATAAGVVRTPASDHRAVFAGFRR
ncbi:endonuclease/exonuclease/phosphatase family protein [Solwaraspora sp. WMMD406]|uniref:endonuclease/exonuclease/phosphatase family protein n=1 Tax=Solwaraspora sp. WMMD406 TaxID=3016095 RepID=UPI002416F41F|nr:endonuclease/exonuclease/phosphatase family protein [Solwaraspora sp. WMMD406]MDG4766302.1 endonuclease/exonuclease/phosphatase family protein [Solwaraspora sp. WMMD406]